MPHAAERRTILERAALWAPVALYAAVIFAASSIEHPGALPGGTPDYVAHAVLYAGFAVVLLRALCAARWSAATGAQALTATAAAAAYGLTDEIHQLFVPGRTFAASDLVANLAGAALGAGVALALARAVRTWRPARTRYGP